MPRGRGAVVALALALWAASLVPSPPAAAGNPELASIHLDAPRPGFATVDPPTVYLSSPAVADLDGDAFDDVVAASFDRLIYAVDRNGNDLRGWPFHTVDTTWSSPALADIDGNGRLSVVIGSDFGYGGAPAFNCVSPPTQGLLL